MKGNLSLRDAWSVYLCLTVCLVGIFLGGVRLGGVGVSSAAPSESREKASEFKSQQADLSPGEQPVAVYNAGSEDARTDGKTQIPETPASSPSSRSGEPEGSSALAGETLGELELTTQEPSGTDIGSPEPVPLPGPGYTIQVAAYSSRKEAESMLTRLEAHNFRGRIRVPGSTTGDRLFRVWVGSFPTLEDARLFEQELKQAGFLTYARKTE